ELCPALTGPPLRAPPFPYTTLFRSLPGMPQYRKINPSQAPIMILALTSDTRPTSEIYDIASTVLRQKVAQVPGVGDVTVGGGSLDRKSTRLNSSHVKISYAVFCLKK